MMKGRRRWTSRATHLCDTPAEAENMKARSNLLAALIDLVKSWGLTQEQAAAHLCITRPRLDDLMRGKLSKFSLDALVIAAAMGMMATGLSPNAGDIA